jgi:hypothetical protein
VAENINLPVVHLRALKAALTALESGQQTGSKRPKTVSLSHAESNRRRAEKPHK